MNKLIYYYYYYSQINTCSALHISPSQPLYHNPALSRSHTELSHVRSRTSCHMTSSSVNTTSCFIRIMRSNP